MGNDLVTSEVSDLYVDYRASGILALDYTFNSIMLVTWQYANKKIISSKRVRREWQPFWTKLMHIG